MDLCQSDRAIKARKWRLGKREKRRFNDLLTEYTKVKYRKVFRECKELYESLNKEYPNKHDLTKTTEFKSWKTLLTGKSSVLIETEPTSPPVPDEAEPTSTLVLTEAEPTSPPVPGEAEPTSTPVLTEAEPTSPPVPGEVEPTSTPVLTEAEPTSTPVLTEAEPTSPPVPDEAEPTPTPVIGETEPTSPPVPDETEPTSTPSNEAGQNILQIAAEDLIPTSPQINIDEVIDGIIRDLQQDDDMRDILNGGNNGELDRMDEDEGIGLITELEEVIEPLDYEVELW